MSQLSFKVRTPPAPPQRVEIPFWLAILICVIAALIVSAPAIAFLLVTNP